MQFNRLFNFFIFMQFKRLRIITNRFLKYLILLTEIHSTLYIILLCYLITFLRLALLFIPH